MSLSLAADDGVLPLSNRCRCRYTFYLSGYRRKTSFLVGCAHIRCTSLNASSFVSSLTDLLKRTAALHARDLHNPASPNSDPRRHSHVSSLLYLLLKATASQLLQVPGPCGDSESKQYGQTVLSTASPLEEITRGVALADIDRNNYLRYVEAGRLIAKTAGLEPGASGLLINGRVKFHPLLRLYALPPPDSVLAGRRPNRIRRLHRGGLRDFSGV